ncbi:hypothetical protein M2360_003681 [Rhizobium sp. SG_E_25_P2]|uniref:hypothetical protein n=1 Tax=Rhizobium sp. SG_E_25_P2 TaxID=2879942 RepID=UPI002474BC0F|nr:hypothetical protein [Rhizobium sp. SG_E_25_P2]MDH6268276.1 hypothetical protein [Rhizobium sp. SG_E_25_P2]
MKTSADYQREYRQRKKKEDSRKADAANPVFRRPFNEYYDWQDTTGVDIPFDVMGVDWLTFDDDSGPKPKTDQIDPEEFAEDYAAFKGSLGRAELTIGCLLDAAVALAEIVNAYKTEEIAARIAEIEAADLTNPAIKKQALADIAKLTRYRDELSKSVRWTLPQWKVKGE